MQIDPRLIDPDGVPDIMEDFNRICALIDVQGAVIEDLGAVIEDLKGLAVATVTFDSNGGTEVDPQVVPYEGTAVEPEDPTKEEATFAGWFAPEAEASFDFDTPIKANLTLTAHWE